MNWFQIVKRHFEAKRYEPEDVAVFVVANKITPEQYEEITQQEYPYESQ